MSLRAYLLGLVLGAGHLMVALIPNSHTRFFFASLLAAAFVVIVPILWNRARRNTRNATLQTMISSAPLIERILKEVDQH